MGLTCGRTRIEDAVRDANGCAINEHGQYTISLSIYLWVSDSMEVRDLVSY